MLTIAVLAGGKSLRMGEDKSIMGFQGEVLIKRILNRLAGGANEVIIIAPRKDQYLCLGVKIVPDILPGRGPLGGLYTALSNASNQEVALVACDMPFVNSGLLKHQRDVLISENVDVVVPSSEQGLEPLHAVYRKSTCIMPVYEAIEAGENRLVSWFDRVKVLSLAKNETTPFDPLGLMFLNINTPEEFARAEELSCKNSGS